MTSNGSGVVQRWLAADDALICARAADGAHCLADRLGRTPAAVRNRAGILGVRLGAKATLPHVRHRAVTLDLVRQHIHAATEPDPFGGCWLWAYLGMRNGYGRFGLPGWKGSAHRASYRAFNGPIPAGMVVRHRCDTPACVNPDHLVVGSYQDNNDDMMRRGRGSKRHGELNTQAKLTADRVRDIKRRVLSREPYRTIAADYGITEATISDIKHGRSWASVSL